MSREKKSSEEKLVCVLEYVEKNKSCKEVATKYNITAHQLRDWIRKYKESGVASLEDFRGQSKAIDDMTQEDKDNLKTKELERENELLKAEVALLKKLGAIKRRVM